MPFQAKSKVDRTESARQPQTKVVEAAPRKTSGWQIWIPHGNHGASITSWPSDPASVGPQVQMNVESTIGVANNAS